MESFHLRVLPCLAALSLVASLPGPPAPAEGPGIHATGTWTTDWLADADSADRDLVITAWYPAIPGSGEPAGHYAPAAAGHDGVQAASRRNALVAQSNAPWPMVLLVPGRGVPSFSYTMLGEALAGYGFVVVAVDSPETGRQYFADGRTVPPDAALAPPPGLMAGPYDAVDRFFADAAERGADDLVRVLDLILESDSAIPFASHVDAGRIGALGHSLGGRIAGAAAARDQRIVAWAGIEGLAPRTPRRRGLGQPAMVVLSDGVWPYAIRNVRELAWCTRHPTYFLRVPGIGHNTITDHVTPDGTVGVSDGHGQLVEIIRRFFAYHFSDLNSEVKAWPTGIHVETHVAPSEERPQGLRCHE